MALDVITKYYDKREKPRSRQYYNSPDELFLAKGRTELIGRHIIPSWFGVKNISVEVGQ